MARETTVPKGKASARGGPVGRALPTVSSFRAPADQSEAPECRLSDVELREEVEFVRFDMPEELAEPLLERGILPGCRLCPVRTSPSGDPVVMVDGSLLALRRETAGCLCVKRIQH
jgi:Fe2+ transport system protein FeoA